jgi:hypothetical protein
LRAQACLAPWELPELGPRPTCSGVRPLVEAPILCLSIDIPGYDDPDLHLPSDALTLHLWSCEIVTGCIALAVHSLSLSQSVGVGLGLHKKSRANAWNSFKTSICRR